jgi:hypothetical protein
MESIGSIPSTSSLASSNAGSYTGPARHTIDQLALNMGFGGIKPSINNPPNLTSTTSTSTSNSMPLINSNSPVFQPVITPSDSQQKFEFTDNISLDKEISNDTENDTKERIITKVDPVDMTAKPAVVTVLKDPVRRAAMLLAGPKFQLNYNEIPQEKLQINSDTIYSVAVSRRINQILLKLIPFRLSLE